MDFPDAAETKIELVHEKSYWMDEYRLLEENQNHAEQALKTFLCVQAESVAKRLLLGLVETRYDELDDGAQAGACLWHDQYHTLWGFRDIQPHPVDEV